MSNQNDDMRIIQNGRALHLPFNALLKLVDDKKTDEFFKVNVCLINLALLAEKALLQNNSLSVYDESKNHHETVAKVQGHLHSLLKAIEEADEVQHKLNSTEKRS